MSFLISKSNFGSSIKYASSTPPSHLSSQNLVDENVDPSDYLNALKRHPHLCNTEQLQTSENEMKMSRGSRIPVAGVDGCWTCGPDGCGNINVSGNFNAL
jgi:hypothetical protein